MSDATSSHSVPVETPATRRTAFDARLSRFSDWLNPILIKETRQATKSIAFAIVFLFFLAISWFVLLATTIAAGESLETRAWGEDFFYWFYGVLSFATMVIVPFTAYRSLLTEREHNTYELLSISTLKPQQVGALVIEPTRELAVQVASEVRRLVANKRAEQLKAALAHTVPGTLRAFDDVIAQS